MQKVVVAGLVPLAFADLTWELQVLGFASGSLVAFFFARPKHRGACRTDALLSMVQLYCAIPVFASTPVVGQRGAEGLAGRC